MTTRARAEPRCSWSEAYETAHAAPSEPSTNEEVPLADAAGRVLGRDLRSLVDLPGYDAAAMDGYAVVGPPPWQLIDCHGAQPGRPWPGVLRTGQAVPVATGAEAPPGWERVVPAELTHTSNGRLLASELPPKPHVRRRGEETRADDIVARAGDPVTPALLGLAAATGHDVLVLRRQPRVLVIVTGDELLTTGEPPAGLVRDAIGPMLAPILSSVGSTLVRTDRRGDADHLDLFADAADVVVVTGSTSVGTTDHLRAQIAAVDRIIDGVDCHPGHPMLLARTTEGPWIVGLPGNPYAAFVAIHTLLVPLLAGLTGSPAHQTRRIRMPPSGRDRGTQVVPVRKRGRAWVACPGHSAASLRGVARAQGLAAVEPDGKAMLLHL